MRGRSLLSTHVCCIAFRMDDEKDLDEVEETDDIDLGDDDDDDDDDLGIDDDE